MIKIHCANAFYNYAIKVCVNDVNYIEIVAIHLL